MAQDPKKQEPSSNLAQIQREILDNLVARRRKEEDAKKKIISDFKERNQRYIKEAEIQKNVFIRPFAVPNDDIVEAYEVANKEFMAMQHAINKVRESNKEFDIFSHPIASKKMVEVLELLNELSVKVNGKDSLITKANKLQLDFTKRAVADFTKIRSDYPDPAFDKKVANLVETYREDK